MPQPDLADSPIDRSSGFARLQPRVARAVLQLFFLVAAVFVAIGLSPQGMGFATGPRFADRPTDIDLYNAEIDAIRGGESYYSAAARELHAAGFPTKSIFNWRTPLPMWLIAELPEPGGRALIGTAAFLLVAGSGVWVMRRRGAPAGIVAAILVFAAVMPCFLPRVYVMPVLWAGVFIGLSLICYAANWRTSAIFLGLAALAMRDLAALYCWIAAAMALRDRRWTEVNWWGLGFLAYAGYFFLIHAQQVGSHRPLDGIAHDGSWLQFGGAAFAISLAQVNAVLLSLPQAVAAVFLACALLGFASARNPALQLVGLTASGYITLFAFVGHPFNQYWGAMLAPLLAIGVALCPGAIVDLVRAMRRCEAEQDVALPAQRSA